MFGLVRKSVCITLLSLLAVTAKAALVSVEPGVWRDTATNLEWLSVSHTTTHALGLTDNNDEFSTTTASEIMSAVAATDYVQNQGFRVARSSEVTALYAGSGGAIEFADNGYGGPNAEPELYKLGITEFWVFQGPDYSNTAGQDQYGLHFADDGSSLRSSNMYLDGLVGFDSYPNMYVYGGYYNLDTVIASSDEFSSYTPPFSSGSETAVYLVRTVVPVPPAIWLFGSGLLALWRLGKRS